MALKEQTRTNEAPGGKYENEFDKEPSSSKNWELKCHLVVDFGTNEFRTIE